jgi:hypothetical protein
MRLVVLPPRDDVPTVAVLGAVGPDKGARRLERMVELARARGANVRFVLIGYLDREHGPWQSDDARWIVNGRYAPHDLPDLFAHYRVSLVMFPSAGPETFSFTLSESWAAGRPVLVPPIGALAERVREFGGGWCWSAAEWASEARMLDVLLARLADRGELAAAAEHARRIPQPSLTQMAAQTIAIYERSIGNPAALEGMQPLASARVRDALGYRLWYPPEPVERAAAREPVRADSTADVQAASVATPIDIVSSRDFGASESSIANDVQDEASGASGPSGVAAASRDPAAAVEPRRGPVARMRRRLRVAIARRPLLAAIKSRLR